MPPESCILKYQITKSLKLFICKAEMVMEYCLAVLHDLYSVSRKSNGLWKGRRYLWTRWYYLFHVYLKIASLYFI